MTSGERGWGLQKHAFHADLHGGDPREPDLVCVDVFKIANCQGENIFTHSLSRRALLLEPTGSLLEVNWPQSTWKS